LFAIISFFHVSIFDKFVSFINEGSDIVEIISILHVTQNLIPWSSLDRFLWHGCGIKSGDSNWIHDFNSIARLNILWFHNDFVGLTEHNSIKEVWKVFINHDVLSCHCETPGLQEWRENKLNNENCEWCNNHN